MDGVDDVDGQGDGAGAATRVHDAQSDVTHFEPRRTSSSLPFPSSRLSLNIITFAAGTHGNAKAAVIRMQTGTETPLVYVQP